MKYRIVIDKCAVKVQDPDPAFSYNGIKELYIRHLDEKDVDRIIRMLDLMDLK